MANKYLKAGAIESRLYQETIFAKAIEKNTLVVLPTGLGKTYVGAMVAAHRLENSPGKILFMAPTRPLVEQHCSMWRNIFNLDASLFQVFTGKTLPEKREKEYRDAEFIFATPQVVQNDIISGRIGLAEFALLIFDEAHRASGDYPYGFISEKYVDAGGNPHILALTASPGSSTEEIDRVCNALHINTVEMRTREDTDVKPYVKACDFKWEHVALPRDFLHVKSLIETCLKEYLVYLKKGGVIKSVSVKGLRKKQILMLQGELGRRARDEPEVRGYLSATAAVMKLYHALELLETQGTSPLCEYLKKLEADRTKAAQRLWQNMEFKAAAREVRSLKEQGIEHPKLERLVELLKGSGDKKSIVFANYRASVSKILERLKEEGMSACKLIGQAREGQSQKNQIETLEKFREGEFSVLIATAVGEEGLDIPAVDHVIFYEPVPSAIRSIQRGGRTARHAPGKITVLMAKGTRDEAYYWSSKRKREKMENVIRNADVTPKDQRTLDAFKVNEEGKVVVFADTRESGTGVLKKLSLLGVDIRMKQLEVADYQVSTRVGVERKKVDDFLQSLINGRLLTQAKNLAMLFERPVIIIEGGSLFGKRNIHPNAIRGCLATLAIDFGISVLQTEDVEETAKLVEALAKREQLDSKKEVGIRSGKMPRSLTEQQRFLVESLPNVGPKLAKRMLEEFKSVKKIVNASETQLKRVEKLGEKKVKDIRKVIDAEYED